MRPRLEPRLQLAKCADRSPNWIIRDGPRTIRTGALEHESEKALDALNDHLIATGHMVGLRSEMARRPIAAGAGTIYFITCEAPDYPIKIGIATNLGKRLRGIQIGSPFRIVLLAQMPGSYFDERLLHGQFKELHLRGEWFRRGDALMQFIDETARRG